MNINNLNITPDPLTCTNKAGGVNSVIVDHATGFLAAGCLINAGKDGLNIVHALAQARNTDIFHCHGLYPIGEGYFDNVYSDANDMVLANALRAKKTICVSEFSADILRHRLHIDPIVIRNGIWIDEYISAGDANGAVLFPKANVDANARPDAVYWLRDNTDLPLLSITQLPNIKSTGILDRKSFLNVLRSCSIYLGTTKENSSMATMEAMISGVPVVGYDTGFNTEMLVNGIGCELVCKDDLLGIQYAIQKVRGNWQKYSKDARAFAEKFDWQPVIDQLLQVYSDVESNVENNDVSIIIPVHNYEQYLSEAITSALEQTIPCEVIVVDDKSTDKSLEIANSFVPKVKVIANEKNIGVAETRNKGIEQARGTFIVCLDADDRLHPSFAQRHLSSFKDRQVAITYAPIAIIDEQGRDTKQRIFRQPASPLQQSVGRNQIPSCCMFRKEFWMRAGGYDKRYTPAEDANLWLKIFILGGIAKQVSKEPIMGYRSHGNSLSSSGRFPDWWKDMPRINAPIRERDVKLEIVLNDADNLKEILWQLESLENLNWTCSILSDNHQSLRQTFPWITHRLPSRKASVINLMDGATLRPDFITSFAQQTPPWITEPRYQ